MTDPSPAFLDVVGLLMTDAAFKSAFAHDPAAAVAARGLALTSDELAQLAGADGADGSAPSGDGAIGHVLDDRVKKRSHGP